MFNFIHSNLFVFFVTLIFWATPALSSDNTYLDALEAEAESSNQLTSQPQDSVEPTPSSDAFKQQMEEYRTLLKKNYPATYNAYVKLSPHDKATVVHNYFDNDKNTTKASHLLFSLYFKSKREKREHDASN